MFAIFELGTRLNSDNKTEILSAEDVWKLCGDINESKKENFLAFYLDTQNRLIERQIISVGTDHIILTKNQYFSFQQANIL